jgi:hypothetical protein
MYLAQMLNCSDDYADHEIRKLVPIIPMASATLEATITLS